MCAQLVDRIGHSWYFTMSDLTKGYYQVPTREDDRQKTDFTTPLGQKQFLRMPFGLKGVPATFQQLVDDLLEGTDDFAAAYIDDVVVYLKTWEEHLTHLKEVLKRITAAGLTLQLDKCKFGAGSCIYLEHEVGRGKVKPEYVKVKAIDEFTRPMTKQDIRAFIVLIR